MGLYLARIVMGRDGLKCCQKTGGMMEIPEQAGKQPLRNARHEAFARHMSGGESQTQAYKMAGYAELSADANAARLMGNEGISARIDYLKIRAADQAIMSRSRALVRLSELAERSEDPNAIAAIRELAKLEAWNKELSGINMNIAPVKLCFVEANEKDFQKVIETETTETTEPKEKDGS